MSAPVSIIAGLGNPGGEYERTLHNAGFWFVDALVRKFGGSLAYQKKFDADVGKVRVAGNDVWLVKPQAFMNLSGQPIRGVLDYYRLDATSSGTVARTSCGCGSASGIPVRRNR